MEAVCGRRTTATKKTMTDDDRPTTNDDQRTWEAPPTTLAREGRMAEWVVLPPPSRCVSRSLPLSHTDEVPVGSPARRPTTTDEQDEIDAVPADAGPVAMSWQGRRQQWNTAVWEDRLVVARGMGHVD